MDTSEKITPAYNPEDEFAEDVAVRILPGINTKSEQRTAEANAYIQRLKTEKPDTYKLAMEFFELDHRIRTYKAPNGAAGDLLLEHAIQKFGEFQDRAMQQGIRDVPIRAWTVVVDELSRNMPREIGAEIWTMIKEYGLLIQRYKAALRAS